MGQELEVKEELYDITVELLKSDMREAVQTAKLSRNFKIHFLLGSGLTGISFAVWLFINFVKPLYPFFIYVATFFLITVCVHFYIFIRNKEYLPFHFALFVILNANLFLSWIFSNTKVVWFIYPSCVTLLIFLVHYCHARFKKNKHLWFYIHIIFFFVLNVMFFMLYMETKADTNKNWLVWPFFTLSLPLAIHYSLHFHPRHWFRLHLVIFVNIQLLFFFTWAALGLGFPWWVFPLMVWGLALTIHGYYSPSSPSPPLDPLDNTLSDETHPNNNLQSPMEEGTFLPVGDQSTTPSENGASYNIE